MSTSEFINGITENSLMTTKRYERTRKLFTLAATTDNRTSLSGTITPSSQATFNIAYNRQTNVVKMFLLVPAACIVFSVILVVCVFTSFWWRGRRHAKRTEDRYYRVHYS